MEKIFLTLFILCFSSVFAQKSTSDFVGYYKLNGGVFNLKKDGTFSIIAYATLITGSWEAKDTEISRDGKTKEKVKIATLTPYHPEFPFSVFGRKNPEIKKGYEFQFRTRDEMEADRVYIGSSLQQMQAFFNPSPNCFNSKYIHKSQETTPKEFILADLNEYRYLEKGKYEHLFTFSVGEYNDFIIEHIPIHSDNYRKFYFALINNQLVDLKDIEDGTIKKADINDFSEEDMKFINAIDTQNPYINDNHRMRNESGEILKGGEFVFITDEKGEIWYKYKNQKEENYSLYDKEIEKMYKNQYKKMPMKVSPLQKFTPLKKTIFHADCGGRYENSRRKVYSGD